MGMSFPASEEGWAVLPCEGLCFLLSEVGLSGFSGTEDWRPGSLFAPF